MPKIKIDHVVSFSSEDPIHVANNVLSGDPAKKWKCQKPGERSATIVLQLEKACVISSIDIGNENSAYIEVLVTRSSTIDDYKVLMVMSSFMTAMEARQTTNINKVKMITTDQLSKPECEQKWDRVKIVCTQPFNRHVQYGLSFINLYTQEDKELSVPKVTNTFALRADSPEHLTIGSLFAHRKEEPLKGAAAIREASSLTALSLHGTPKCKAQLKETGTTPKNNGSKVDVKPLPRDRDELLYNNDEETPNEKIDKVMEKHRQNKEEETKDTLNSSKGKNRVKEVKTSENEKINKVMEKHRQNKEEKTKDTSNNKRKNKVKEAKTSENLAIPSTSKRKTEGELPKPAKKLKENTSKFTQLLRNIVFVISGIQNPDRANIRRKAIDMGAKYKPDWDRTCTHLICAFRNTPKFMQVKGKGKIVKKDWIEDCHSFRKRLPWRRYALDRNDAMEDESEEEISEEIEAKQEETEGYDDSKMEERISEILAKNKENDPYSQDTDEENINKNPSDKNPIKFLDFFDGKNFFIDPQLSNDTIVLLKKYISAYKGNILNDPLDSIHFIITNENNSETMKNINLEAFCVKPDFIWDCHNSQDYLSFKDYQV